MIAVTLFGFAALLTQFVDCAPLFGIDHSPFRFDKGGQLLKIRKYDHGGFGHGGWNNSRPSNSSTISFDILTTKHQGGPGGHHTGPYFTHTEHPGTYTIDPSRDPPTFTHTTFPHGPHRDPHPHPHPHTPGFPGHPKNTFTGTHTIYPHGTHTPTHRGPPGPTHTRSAYTNSTITSIPGNTTWVSQPTYYSGTEISVDATITQS